MNRSSLVPPAFACFVFSCTTATAAAASVMPPLNDDCNAAQPINGPGPFFFDNLTASAGLAGQNNANCLFATQIAIAHDVWFTWCAQQSGSVTLTLCNQTTIDSKVAVYAGPGCPVGQALACNDDACGLQSQLTFSAVAGGLYTIQVGTYPSAPG